MEIREAKLEDAEVITEELWMPLAKEMQNYSDSREFSDNIENQALKRRKEIVDSNESICYVAEEDKIIGVVSGSVTENGSELFQKSKIVRIHDIYIKSDYRRKGLASKLIEKIENWAENKDCEAVELSVDSPNEAAFEFYLDEGYFEKRKTMRKDI